MMQTFSSGNRTESSLRHAKDKEEFDRFMAQHRTRPAPPSDRSAQWLRQINPTGKISLNPSGKSLL
jgi:Protein of unknown function (DUF2852)